MAYTGWKFTSLSCKGNLRWSVNGRTLQWQQKASLLNLDPLSSISTFHPQVHLKVTKMTSAILTVMPTFQVPTMFHSYHAYVQLSQLNQLPLSSLSRSPIQYWCPHPCGRNWGMWLHLTARDAWKGSLLAGRIAAPSKTSVLLLRTWRWMLGWATSTLHLSNT